MSSKGMIHLLSCPHTLQHNGIAEKKTTIFLMLLVPWYFKLISLYKFGKMQSLLLVI